MNLSTNEWADAERIANLPAVHEVIQGFAEDPTGDNGTMVVREVLRALAAATAPIVAQPVVADERAQFIAAAREIGWPDSAFETGPSSSFSTRYTEWAWRLWQERAKQAAPAIPPGWQLVPQSPTQEMLNRAIVWTQTPHAIYAAMLASAPAALTDGEA